MHGFQRREVVRECRRRRRAAAVFFQTPSNLATFLLAAGLLRCTSFGAAAATTFFYTGILFSETSCAALVFTARRHGGSTRLDSARELRETRRVKRRRARAARRARRVCSAARKPRWRRAPARRTKWIGPLYRRRSIRLLARRAVKAAGSWSRGYTRLRWGGDGPQGRSRLGGMVQGGLREDSVAAARCCGDGVLRHCDLVGSVC